MLRPRGRGPGQTLRGAVHDSLLAYAFTDRFVAEPTSHGVTDPDQGEISLREVLVHMVEDFARHSGH